MLDKLAEIEGRYLELERLLADPEVTQDYEKVVQYSKERSSLQEIVSAYRDYQKQAQELQEARQMLRDETDTEMRDMARAEIEALESSTEELLHQLKLMMLPKDPRDGKDAIIEIRAGAGGDEAGLFAGDLMRMYMRYADAKGWKTEIISQNDTGGNVIKSVTFEVRGENVFSYLKYESGVHRVQRVPATESQGRIHTSTATVAVLAEMSEVDVELNRNEVRVDVFRSQGAGGQSVNTTDSAVRLTHIPTGIVVEMQDERSQLKNKDRAFKVLVARLYELEIERQRAEREAERRGMVGSGDRSEKIRTYNYPQNRVTDHRINYSSYNLPAVMDGDIDEFIDSLAAQEQTNLLANAEAR